MSTQLQAIDVRWMRRALALARKAKGQTSPNPTVGAVVVRDGRLVGQGHHPRAGEPHAEIFALRQAGRQAVGATLYVTLEPCCHHGQTPPCVEAILEAGIRRVVAATSDPNPRIHGQGLSRLKKRGVQVHCGVLEGLARRLNEDFIKFHSEGLPFVTLKVAMTLDGKIATGQGESRWVTGEKSRAYVHRLRRQHDAVMVGIQTVLADDPQLTVRYRVGKDPHRIIVDSRARLPLSSRLLHLKSTASTWVATTHNAPERRIQQLRKAGVRILKTKSSDGRVDLSELMQLLAEHNILSVMLEGGGQLAWSALEAGIVDKVAFFIAPKIIGGRRAITAVEGTGRRLDEAWRLHDVTIRRLDEDILVEGYNLESSGGDQGPIIKTK